MIESSVKGNRRQILKESKFIMMSLVLGITLGSGAAIIHIQTTILSSLMVIPIIGLPVFAYLALLTKYDRQPTSHYALMLIMIGFSFLSTLILQ